ncbi:hypothetical protein EW146_g10464 [Bondarzewia mesenterica]|uniref:Conserved oligomeric Golgi complex subunit 3 C-terminal domain-containing protein n=1 Tax=Bondarzewia mesenterica TaxID=1095465 RepID=A0A4S4KX05_9AGAM|nr:hypothetical protein EW146_g10464 [Bondarzewia mesenterica]
MISSRQVSICTPAIFDDLAQEAVNLCRQSLTAASDMIKAKNPPSSALDGYLFLVRHMLILKEMTRNLDLVEREMERGSSGSHGVTDTLASMLNRTTSYLPNSVFQSLGMPQGDENIMDAKHASLDHSLIIGIDLELKRACEAVINHIADPICSPLHKFVERVNAYTNTTKGAPLTSNSWAEQSAAETLESDFRHACQRDLRAAAGRLRLYLEDKRTVDVLLQHVRERAEDEYSVFRDLVWSMYAGSLRERVLSAEGMKDLLSEFKPEPEAQGRAHGVPQVGRHDHDILAQYLCSRHRPDARLGALNSQFLASASSRGLSPPIPKTKAVDIAMNARPAGIGYNPCACCRGSTLVYAERVANSPTFCTGIVRLYH